MLSTPSSARCGVMGSHRSQAEVAAYAAGLAQIGLLQSPLLLEALELETAAALAEA